MKQSYDDDDDDNDFDDHDDENDNDESVWQTVFVQWCVVAILSLSSSNWNWLTHWVVVMHFHV